MRTRLFLAALACVALTTRASAQGVSFSSSSLDQFINGLKAERTELDKVGGQLKELDDKIAKFRECSGLLSEAGGGKTGLAAKIAMKAKCGATSDEGMLKDRAKLLVQPEKVGASTAGMKASDYAYMKERATGYVNGMRNFSSAELAALDARKTDLATALGLSLAAASSEDRGTGSGGGLSGRIGNAISSRVRMFTPDMTWAYVGYLWGLMYMSGATMFETAYQPGQWTQWTIIDSSQPNDKLVLERALLSREADGSEWWRIKTINVAREGTDTIIIESQFKKMDANGMAMQVVRMRGKMPGDTEGKELMVPQSMSMLSMSAFPFKPTTESIAGATVGTETVRAGGSSYSAKRVRFGAGGGSMEWWLAEKAPGGVVRVQFTGQEKNEKWTMEMTGAGAGAKSELGVK